MTTLTLCRDLGADETFGNGPLASGTPLYLFTGYTYGCISPAGIAVSRTEGYPFFEVPRDAVVQSDR